MGTTVIRQMTRSEADGVLAWAQREGWNPGLHDAGLFYETDPEGFFVAERDGEIIGAISAVRYGVGFGFVGLFIVVPGERGRRVGILLGRRAMEWLAGRVIGTDGVLAKQDQYARLAGFVPAHRSVRFAGKIAGQTHGEVLPLQAFRWRDVVGFDTGCFPAPREDFLRRWIAQDDALALGADGPGGLAGFGVIRRCRAGCKVGPLFAAGAGVASRILTSLAGFAAGEEIFLDVPECNPDGTSLAVSLGMQPVFATARMYAGPAPELAAERIFGVTSFELG